MTDYSKYQQMQRDYYDGDMFTPDQIVGNYAWHEEVPYETQLLFKDGDIRKPLFNDTKDKIALDFACGPGRMIKRMSKFFKRVDGCDISHVMLSEAKRRLEGTESKLYLTSGDNLGEVPQNHYDFIYSTIAMQHICVHSMRMNILRKMNDALKSDGCITIQMGFSPEHTALTKKMSGWNDDFISATGTNSANDVVITSQDLTSVKGDFESIFKNTSFWFYDCHLKWHDFNGQTHPTYWASHWIFVNAWKR